MSDSLTLDHLRHAMSRLRDVPTFNAVVMPPAWAKTMPAAKDPASSLFGAIRVHESMEAKMPARVHKRRSGSEAYHRRIQKKWNKRFGYVPAAFLFNDHVLLEYLRPFPQPVFA